MKEDTSAMFFPTWQVTLIFKCISSSCTYFPGGGQDSVHSCCGLCKPLPNHFQIAKICLTFSFATSIVMPLDSIYHFLFSMQSLLIFNVYCAGTVSVWIHSFHVSSHLYCPVLTSSTNKLNKTGYCTFTLIQTGIVQSCCIVRLIMFLQAPILGGGNNCFL